MILYDLLKPPRMQKKTDGGVKGEGKGAVKVESEGSAKGESKGKKGAIKSKGKTEKIEVKMEEGEDVAGVDGGGGGGSGVKKRKVAIKVSLPPTRKIDVRLPGKGNSNSHGERPVY